MLLNQRTAGGTVPGLDDEAPIRLQDVPALLPRLTPDGKSVHWVTVNRWATKGVRNVKLRTMLIGGHRRTTRNWVEEFLAKLSERDNQAATPQATQSRAAELRAIETKLAKAGL